jgi:predicted ArsR family transcriptional regulator
VDGEQALGVLTLLNDDIRRRLYHFVRRSAHPVTREEAARALSISAKLAAFHLDKLVDGELLQANFDTPGGLRRRVGRAPKRYRPSSLELTLSLPQRRYDLVGEILLDTLSETSSSEEPVDTARRIAYERGQGIGIGRKEQLRRGRLGAERTIAETRSLLEELGFEPAQAAQCGLMLRNCPFHALAQRDPELVCGLNASLIDGILRGLGNTTVSAELTPEEGLCCVRIRRPDNELPHGEAPRRS